MKQFDILVVGELNMDLILSKVHSFPRMGTEVLADEMTLTLGSSSAIFACNAATLGPKVGYLGKIGTDDFGTSIIDTLKSRNVKTVHIIRSADYKTGITVALSFGNDRAMITYPGAMEYLSGENVTPEILRDARHVHFSSIFLQPRIKRDLKDILRRVKEAGITTSLDTQWDPAEKWDLDLHSILPLVDVFLPNEDEIKALTRQKTVEEALATLGSSVNLVGVKMGSSGSLGFQKGQIVRVEPFLNTEVVDAIGAGDSFDAGFVYRYLRGGTLEQCLRSGNLMGAINTTAAGGTTAFSSFERVRDTAQKKWNVNLMEI